MDKKLRIPFTIEKWTGKVLGRGVLYADGNIQVLWLSDRGWTGIQYASLSYAIGILPGATIIRLEDGNTHGIFSGWVANLFRIFRNFMCQM